MDLPPEKKNKGKSESKDKVELSCPWVIQASGSIVERSWNVKTYHHEKFIPKY